MRYDVQVLQGLDCDLLQQVVVAVHSHGVSLNVRGKHPLGPIWGVDKTMGTAAEIILLSC